MFPSRINAAKRRRLTGVVARETEAGLQQSNASTRNQPLSAFNIGNRIVNSFAPRCPPFVYSPVSPVARSCGALRARFRGTTKMRLKETAKERTKDPSDRILAESLTPASLPRRPLARSAPQDELATTLAGQTPPARCIALAPATSRAVLHKMSQTVCRSAAVPRFLFSDRLESRRPVPVPQKRRRPLCPRRDESREQLYKGQFSGSQ